MTFREVEKIHKMYTKNSIKCKCGHSISFSSCEERKLCSWCGNFVYKNKRDQFKYDLTKELNK